MPKRRVEWLQYAHQPAARVGALWRGWWNSRETLTSDGVTRLLGYRRSPNHITLFLCQSLLLVVSCCLGWELG